MARKKKHEEHENHERWLVSYADFITLLFAFFVVMYSISSVNEGKYRVLSDSMVAAFRAAPKSIEPVQVGREAKSPRDTTLEQRTDPNVIRRPPMPIPRKTMDQQDKINSERASSPAALKAIADKIERAMAGLIVKNMVSIRRSDFWLEVEINTNILFPSGVSRLQEQAIPTLSEIAKILRDFPNPIRVEGFTDNLPINTLAFPSNWELSAARSASVVHVFMDSGVSPERMSAVGYGEYRPVADNSTEDGRNKNRKVVIVILNDESSGRVYDRRKLSSGDGSDSLTTREVAPQIPSGKHDAPNKNPHEPVDVTGKEVTDRGSFTVIDHPVKSSSTTTGAQPSDARLSQGGAK
ncbi:MAG: flagellar motor protein MotD [Gammaproteobacteria bacterium]